MRLRYDRLAKVLCDQAFGLARQVATQFEAFHATPSVDAVRACINKQLPLHRNLQREAARPGQAGQAPPRTVPPRLWILSPGRPRQAMDALAFEPMPKERWPVGFWQAAPGLQVHLVVLRELPARRDTLLLRLLGRGQTYLRAIHELHALPRDAWEAELAIPLLLAFQVEIAQTAEEDAMNQANELQAIYDEWKKRVVHTAWKAGEEAGRKQGEETGRKEGRLQALRETLSKLYEARFGALRPEVQAVIEATEDIDTLAQWVALFATRTPEEIGALVLGHRAVTLA